MADAMKTCSCGACACDEHGVWWTTLRQLDGAAVRVSVGAEGFCPWCGAILKPGGETEARAEYEEREGRCFCANDPYEWRATGVSFLCANPCWYSPDCDDIKPTGCHCLDCGAELGNGVARRNADAGRLDALEAMLAANGEANPHCGLVTLFALRDGRVCIGHAPNVAYHETLRAALDAAMRGEEAGNDGDA